MLTESALSPYEELSTKARSHAVRIAGQVSPTTLAGFQPISFEEALHGVRPEDHLGMLQLLIIRELESRLERLKRPDPKGRPAGLPTRKQLLDDNPSIAKLIRKAYRHVPGELILPDKIGPYLVTGHIADGGQGRVVEVRLPDSSEAAIVKYSDNPRHIERLRCEAELLHRLNCPGIRKPIGELTKVGRFWYLALEMIPGSNLDHLRRNNNLSNRQIVRVIKQLGAIVSATNAEGVYHCDIKPSNVIHAYDETHLIDFGMAVRSHTDGNKPVPYSNLGGTRGYTAPELVTSGGQDQVEVKPSHRTEVYSLGATLYFLLYGESPSLPVEPGRRVTPPSRNGVQRLLRDVCRQAMDTRPEERHRNASAFVEAIRRRQLKKRMLHIAYALLVTLVASVVVAVAVARMQVYVIDGNTYHYVTTQRDGARIYEYHITEERTKTYTESGPSGEPLQRTRTYTVEVPVTLTVPEDRTLREYLLEEDLRTERSRIELLQSSRKRSPPTKPRQTASDDSLFGD